MEKDLFMMWLSEIRNIHRSKIDILLNHFDNDVEAIWRAPGKVLKKIEGIDDVTVSLICSSRKTKELNDKLAVIRSKGLEYISITNPKYPELLKQIYDPPYGLYYKGELTSNDIDNVSIIGSRRCSEYGLTHAFKFAKELAQANVCIVSGMALGIDSSAHNGAIKGQGKTIAVLASGVDVCYPTGNEKLMNKIVENGCVISEMPLGSRAMPYNFPRRNRIMSGLSKILIVIEAGKRSGTSITVNHALDSGREVFAMPGNINSPFSVGTNNLIKEGCRPITDINDVLSELGIERSKNQKNKSSEKDLSGLTEQQLNVYKYINNEPVNIDILIEKLDIEAQSMQYILTTLQLSGLIKRLAGSMYIRVY